MRKLLFTFLIVFSVTKLNAQYVNIPDPYFVSWLNSHGFAPCMNGNQLNIQCVEVLNATSLQIGMNQITDLSGLQYFVNVTGIRLTVSDSVITVMPPNLQSLYIDGGNVYHVQSLPSTLKYLTLERTFLQTIPPLSQGFESLYIRNNDSLETLPLFPSTFNDFFCWYNDKLASLPPLGNTQLTSIWCNYNGIKWIPSLPNTLRSLTAIGNELDSLPTLPPDLYTLHVSDNNLDSLPPLPSSLRSLHYANNNISYWPSLPDSLVFLVVSGNNLDSIPSLPSQLSSLRCGNNNLHQLPASVSQLTWLYCEKNYLDTLPTLTRVGWFDCSYNQFKNLSFLNRAPMDFNCSHNQITEIPFSAHTISEWDISNNPISCMPNISEVASGYFYWDSTNISCRPGMIVATYGSQIFPSLSTIPYCDSINISNCPISNNISGNIYIDDNGNCNADSNETKVGNIKINLKSHNFISRWAFSDDSGEYSFNVNEDTFYLSVDTANYPLIVNCPDSNEYIAVIDSSNHYELNKNFSITCKPGFDIGVYTVLRDSGIFRPGNLASVKILAGDISSVYNLHCASGVSGSIKVIIAGPADYAGSTAGALVPLINGDTLIYTINDFGTLNMEDDIGIYLYTDTLAQLNDQVCLNIEVSPDTGDNNISNNEYAICFNVVNSYDPNAKEVSITEISDTLSHWLTYTIYFQNVGSASAQDVYIVDNLPYYVDVNSVQILSASHNPEIHQNYSSLQFLFPNINLPDSSSNEPASHGYVQFKVKSKPGLLSGAWIANQAAIVFDYNIPVITNNAITYIVCPVASIHNMNVSICKGDSVLLGNYYIYDAGTYIDTLQSSNGCDSVVNLDLNVDTLTVQTFSLNGTIHVSGASTYQWYDCTTDSLIPGETDSTFSPVVSGNYAAIIQNGTCVDTTACVQVVITDIVTEAGDELTILPNPFNDMLYWKGNTKYDHLEIYNATGQLIFNSTTGTDGIVKTAAFPNGIYLVTFYGIKGSRYIKMVKE